MPFTNLSDDVVLNIIDKLEDDPRHWSRLACVSTKFSSLIHNICWKRKCHVTIPSVIADLLSDDSDSPPGGWSSMNKLAVCCPGLLHSGVLLENSDFGLERELGPDENYRRTESDQTVPVEKIDTECSSSANGEAEVLGSSDCAWSMFDDLYFDTVYNVSENHDGETLADADEVVEIENRSKCLDLEDKKRKACTSSSNSNCRSLKSHMASGVWNLRREQGNKLLASRFRGDCLYICDWPGCVHIEEKRNYMLFRGVFKNFKRSRVWRTINDGNRSRIDLNCAFCSCKETWDLHSAFCLRRVFGYHDDGEPVVRAYVCENGHVSGAWTELPLYT